MNTAKDSNSAIRFSADEAGVLTISLASPGIRNALNPGMIQELTSVLHEVADNPEIRVVVLRGDGPTFCAGADLRWLSDVAGQTQDELVEDSSKLQVLLNALQNVRKLTIARVQGAAMAGGLGLVACCDVAIAEKRATFSISEVRLGLVPGIIAPFVQRKVGWGTLRHLAMTGRMFDAAYALEIGLIHEIAEDEKSLDAVVSRYVQMGLAASPDAIAMCSQMMARLLEPNTQECFSNEALNWNVQARMSPAAAEGISAFLKRQSPTWRVADYTYGTDR